MSTSHPATGRHVAIACPSCGGGGAVANVALNQARELAKYFSVTLLSDSFPGTSETAFPCLKVNSTRFRWLRRYGHVPREWSFARSMQRALRRLNKVRPLDILVCHGHVLATLTATRLKREIDVPYALVTHGDIFERPEQTYDPRLTWFYKSVTPKAYKDADLVIALSPHMNRVAIVRGANPQNVVVIPIGIDPAEIGVSNGRADTKTDSGTGVLELLYVGRLSVEKGVDVLIEACALLRARQISFRLRIAGDGPMKEGLMHQIHGLGLEGQIKLLGHVGRRDLGPLYQSAHIISVPSRSDTFPTVVLEAMSAGLVVIGSGVGGIPYMIEHGETGWLVSSEDANEIAYRIERAWEDRPGLLEMGRGAQRRAAEHFNVETVGRDLASALCKLTDTPRLHSQEFDSNVAKWTGRPD